MSLTHTAARRIATVLLLAGCSLLGGCEDSAGFGFSVDVPASYGSMELGMSTTRWAGGPFWN